MSWPTWVPILPPWLLPSLATVSLVALVASALLLPRMLAGLDHDLFVRPPETRPWTAGRVLRNIGGIVLILAGVAMLVLPGQGLLTILAGLLISDVPGKRRFAVFFLRRRPVRAAVNGLRARRGQPALLLPDPDDD